MIKNKKYTHTKGGRIEDFDFDNKNKNKNNVSKKYIHFNLLLRDGNIGKFKISQHTFAHFDEFKNVYLNGQIQNFTHIMQYFVVFIFLLGSMRLSETDFKNPDACQGEKTKDGNCYITKKGYYKAQPFNLTIYIKKSNTSNSSNRIFITSLFDKYDKSKLSYPDISYEDIVFNKNYEINYSQDTINKLIRDQDNIINNNYDIAYILRLLNDSSATHPPPQSSPSSQPTSPSPQPKTSNNQLLPTVYTFSIPKNSGGKKNKTYKNTKYKNHKHKKDKHKKDKHKKEKGQKDKGRKTRKK